MWDAYFHSRRGAYYTTSVKFFFDIDLCLPQLQFSFESIDAVMRSYHVMIALPQHANISTRYAY